MQKSKLAIFFSFLPLASPAVSFAADSCNALLTVGIYNVSQSSSANEGESLAKSTFCSADYSLNSTTSSVQASIKAAFSFFSGGASASVTDSQIIETQKNVCTSGFNSSAYSNEASSYSRTIYQGALDAWNQCNTLASKGINFEIQADNTMQGVTVSLSTASTGTTSKFLGLSQTGLGTSVCKTTTSTGKVITLAENTLFTLSSAKKLTVICKRTMKKDGKGNLFADAQALIFNTSTGAYQVPLSGIGSLARSTVDQATAEIRATVDADTQTALTAVNQANSSNSSLISSLSNTVNSLLSGLSSLSSTVSDFTSKSYLTSVPTGTICGFMTNNGATGAKCQGFDPTSSCPTGYSRQGWGVDFGNGMLYFCVKS